MEAACRFAHRVSFQVKCNGRFHKLIISERVGISARTIRECSFWEGKSDGVCYFRSQNFSPDSECRAVSRQQTANQRTTPMTVCRSCGGLPNGESTLQIIRLTALQEYFIREYRYRRFRRCTMSNTIKHKESPFGKIRVGIRFKAPFVADC